MHPLKKRLSLTSCIYVVGAIWLLSCALVAPAVAHTYHVEFQQQGFAICEEFWMEQEEQRLAYAYSTLIVTYILPLSAVSLSYLCISALAAHNKRCLSTVPPAEPMLQGTHSQNLSG